MSSKNPSQDALFAGNDQPKLTVGPVTGPKAPPAEESATQEPPAPPKPAPAPAPKDFDLDRAVSEISQADQEVYQQIISTHLNSWQINQVLNPERAFPKQKSVLAVHWHPEWVPMDLVARRIAVMFPKRNKDLIIPTQHNQILTWGDHAGVEMDCYSSGFQRKVQLLLHFKAERAAGADVLKSMLKHTFKYRSSQLFEFMDSILEPEYEARLEEAVQETGANPELVAFVRFYTARLRKLIELNDSTTPPAMIKNKILSEYVDAQRDRHPGVMVNRALLLLKSVKAIVKRHFSLDYFYRASEVIEETRGLGGGVVIPHPEQFWPILLADYDVDGWEVWNPQSREYTEFLISALNNQNKRGPGKRTLLIFMGDDTHMSVKIKDPAHQERSKLEREVGLQPAWDEVAISKILGLAGTSRAAVIDDYKQRLE